MSTMDLVCCSNWCLTRHATSHVQVSAADRLAAFAKLMEVSVAQAGGRPHKALPRLAITFVSTQLKVRAATSAGVKVIAGVCGGSY